MITVWNPGSRIYLNVIRLRKCWDDLRQYWSWAADTDMSLEAARSLDKQEQLTDG